MFGKLNFITLGPWGALRCTCSAQLKPLCSRQKHGKTPVTFVGSRIHSGPWQNSGSTFRHSGRGAVTDEVFGWWGLDSRAVRKENYIGSRTGT